MNQNHVTQHQVKMVVNVQFGDIKVGNDLSNLTSNPEQVDFLLSEIQQPIINSCICFSTIFLRLMQSISYSVGHKRTQA